MKNVVFLHCNQKGLRLNIMEQKLLGWPIFLWSRKYMFSWHHWHSAYCHLGVLRKHLARFLTCCSHPFSVATSKCTINTKKCQQMPSFQPYIRPFAPGFCNVIDHPSSAGGRAEVKLPVSHGLGAEPEPRFFMRSVPSLRPRPCPTLSLCPQSLPITVRTLQLYKEIPPEMLKHLKRPYGNITFI